MKYDYNQLVSLLPEHWEVLPATPDSNDWEDFSDDGRDYNLPMFQRKDKLARIYINAGKIDTPYMFAIAWYDDGECDGDFATAIKMCDDYVAAYPIDTNREP